MESLVLAVLAATPVVAVLPATWAMLLFGFGGVGLALRRPRRAVARVRYTA